MEFTIAITSQDTGELYFIDTEFQQEPVEDTSLFPNLRSARRCMKSLAGEVYSTVGAKTRLVSGSAGVGKTREMLLEAIRRVKKYGETIILSHARTDEAESLYNEAIAKGAPATFVEGRGPRTCREWSKIEKAPDLGRACRACVHAKECAYPKQLEKAHKAVSEANRTGKGRLVLCPFPTAMGLVQRHRVDHFIIDESPLDQLVKSHLVRGKDINLAGRLAALREWATGVPLLTALLRALRPTESLRQGPHGEINEGGLRTLLADQFPDQQSLTKACNDWLEGCEVLYKNISHVTLKAKLAVPLALKRLIAKLADPSLPYAVTLYRPMGKVVYSYKVTEVGDIKAGKVNLCILDATGDPTLYESILGVEIDHRDIRVLATPDTMVMNVNYSGSIKALQSEAQRERHLKAVKAGLKKAREMGLKGYLFICHKVYETWFREHIQPLLLPGEEAHFTHFFSTRGTNKYRHCATEFNLGTPRADPANLQAAADLTNTHISLWEQQSCEKEIEQCAMRIRPLDGGKKLIINVGRVPLILPGADNQACRPDKSLHNKGGLGEGFTSAPIGSIAHSGQRAMAKAMDQMLQYFGVLRPSFDIWLLRGPEVLAADLKALKGGLRPSEAGAYALAHIYDKDPDVGRELRQQEGYKKARADANRYRPNLGQGMTWRDHVEQLLATLSWFLDRTQEPPVFQWVDLSTLSQEAEAPRHTMRN